MASVSSSVSIQQPVEKVFDYVTNVANHTAWQAGILEAKVSPEGPVQVGSIYQYTTEVMGQKMQTALQVSEFEPNRRWSVTTTGVPRPVQTVYLFEPSGDGTNLTVSMELAGGYPAAAEAMVKAEMQKQMDAQAARIKQAVGG